MPWANSKEISFLQTTSEMNKILENLNYHQVETSDQTQKGVEFFETVLERIGKFGPPKLGLNVLMGESTKSKIINLLSGLKEGKIMLQSGIYRK